MSTKEQVFDQQIAPLLQQVVDICKRHEIPMLAHCQLDRFGHGQIGGGAICATAYTGLAAGSPQLQYAAQILLEDADGPAAGDKAS